MSKVPGQRKLKTKIGLSIAAVSVFIFLVLLFSIPLDDEYSDDVVLSDTLEKRLVKSDLDLGLSPIKHFLTETGHPARRSLYIKRIIRAGAVEEDDFLADF